MGIKTDGDSVFNGNLTTGGNLISNTAFVGESAYSNYAYFGHKDNRGTGNYALLQHPSSHTYLNARSGANIYFRNDNSDRGILYSNGNLWTDGCVYNYGSCMYEEGMSTYVMNTDHWYESGNDGGAIYPGTANAEVYIRGSTMFDCPSCGSTSALDGSSDWGDMSVQGRVLSANSNIHLSPPAGYNVVINDSYRAAGGSGGGVAGLTVEGNVGIGTTAPGAKLDVEGSIRADHAIHMEEGADPNWYPRITFSNSVAGLNWGHSIHTNGNFYLNTNDYTTAAQRTFYVWEHFSVTGSKNFEIPHPLDPNKNLVHSSLEGPEIALFYRGTSQLKNGKAEIELPDYFEAMARKENRSILLTNIDGFDKLSIQTFEDDSQIKDGQFTVIAEKENSPQKFNWEVKAVRADLAPLQVEVPNPINEMK